MLREVGLDFSELVGAGIRDGDEQEGRTVGLGFE
jgi:hypothetical protein